MEPITQAHLKEAVADLKEYVAEKVGDVENQLVRLNGRIQKHDRELAEHGLRLDQFDGVELVDVPAVEGHPTVITARDLKIIVGTIVGLGTIIFGWQQALEIFLNYLKASLK